MRHARVRGSGVLASSPTSVAELERTASFEIGPRGHDWGAENIGAMRSARFWDLVREVLNQ